MAISSNVTVRLPASLRAAAEEIAKADGTTLNQFIVMAVAEKVAVLRTADYLAECAKRADFEAFDRFMSRETEAPRAPMMGPEGWRMAGSTVAASAGRRAEYRRTPLSVQPHFRSCAKPLRCSRTRTLRYVFTDSTILPMSSLTHKVLC